MRLSVMSFKKVFNVGIVHVIITQNTIILYKMIVGIYTMYKFILITESTAVN